MSKYQNLLQYFLIILLVSILVSSCEKNISEETFQEKIISRNSQQTTSTDSHSYPCNFNLELDKLEDDPSGINCNLLQREVDVLNSIIEINRLQISCGSHYVVKNLTAELVKIEPLVEGGIGYCQIILKGSCLEHHPDINLETCDKLCFTAKYPDNPFCYYSLGCFEYVLESGSLLLIGTPDSAIDLITEPKTLNCTH